MYPRYRNHSDVCCFNCSAKLSGEPVPQGENDQLHNAPGHGRYRQHCDACRMFTWYDLYQATTTHERCPVTLGAVYGVHTCNSSCTCGDHFGKRCSCLNQ